MRLQQQFVSWQMQNGANAATNDAVDADAVQTPPTPPTPTLPTPPTASVAAKGLGNDKEEATEIKP